jgi:hypothetical protein
MGVKGPHHYKVTALGSCVKWPLISLHIKKAIFLTEDLPRQKNNYAVDCVELVRTEVEKANTQKYKHEQILRKL